jgi:hypothetical protein
LRGQPRGCWRSSHCRANCSSSSTDRRSNTGTRRTGSRSSCAEMYEISPIPPPIEACAISRLNFIRHHNALILHTKYLHFLTSVYISPPSETVIADALNLWILGSVAGNRNRRRIHLLPIIILTL